ncbi:hypothetical protein BLIG_02174 [Bifidobacterium longum subsp. infantis CCUG 52486]|uniref:Uncharacterized protein n=2 Tax=Bifidobacterium longum TaxID=216816 RepID=C5EDF1_BIFLI|nr:hypothetical protein BLIG_02174 [Bifidobacterium longum subsp. infantis CCUG 52486]
MYTQTKRPAGAGLFYKFNYWSRISAQHHRCNGKSFQCPSNVTVLVTIHYLWALLCSVVLVPHNLFITPVSRNLQRVVVRFLSQLFNRTFWLSENELNRSHRTRPMFDFVRFTAAHGVSRATLAHSKPTNTELT